VIATARSGSWADFPLLVSGVVIFFAAGGAVFLGYRPLAAVVRAREDRYGRILRTNLLINIQPRTVTVMTVVAMLVLGAFGWLITTSLLGTAAGLAAGAFLPEALIRLLRKRRLARLEGQLVSGIQTLASGVRAGLNLVQSMEMVARDGPAPLRQEFAHLLREYEYGVSLEEAMDNSARRIGSGDFRLLFAALQTHRQRGGDLGRTLDRIGESIREIQRLESRVQTLTAQGRATARWLGVMPIVVLTIYYFIDPAGVRSLFVDDLGKLILGIIAALNVVGFLWVKRVVAIDI